MRVQVLLGPVPDFEIFSAREITKVGIHVDRQ